MANSSSSSLEEVVKQVAEQQHSQASEIEKNKTVLKTLQIQLQNLEKQMKCVAAERKVTEWQIHHQDEGIASTKDTCEALETEISVLYLENVKLAFDLEALQEELKIMQIRNDIYYEKISAHREQFIKAESKLPFTIELIQKRALVKDMIANKEELMNALQISEEEATNSVQNEIVNLKGKINLLEETIDEKKNVLQDERNTHARLQKEIEVQNKRYEAILKRLHCQVNKMESSNRQWHWNIQQMEEKVAKLRKLLE
uniref:Coiled-coil domain containing 122 n=1 Tax=Salvator merianae TaxID=96440 RepID=A0A8D0EBL3_SALMN